MWIYIYLIYKQVFEDYKSHLFEGQNVDTAYFLNNPDEKIRNLASEVAIEKDSISKIWARRGATCETPDETYKQDIPKSILCYKLKIIQLASKETLALLKDKTKTIDEQMQILENCKQLKEVEKSLSQNLKRIIII